MNGLFEAVNNLFESSHIINKPSIPKIINNRPIITEDHIIIPNNTKPFKTIEGDSGSVFNIYRIDGKFYDDNGEKLDDDDIKDAGLKESTSAGMKTKARSILKEFNKSDKEITDFTTALNSISKLKWENEITPDICKEYTKKIQDVYINKKEIITESTFKTSSCTFNVRYDESDNSLWVSGEDGAGAKYTCENGSEIPGCIEEYILNYYADVSEIK